MKKILCILIAMMLTLCMVLCGCGKKEESVQITVSEVTHSVFYAPQYAAIALGYFEEEGLEIELINGAGADNVMTAVISGQVEIGLAGPEASIYVYNEGKEDYAQVFAQLTKRDGSFLIAREEKEDFTYADLIGTHVLGGRKGGVPYMTLEYVIKQSGVDISEMDLDTSVEYGMMASVFTAGTGDYVTAFEPTASMLEAEGVGYIVASVGQDSGEIPYTAYFALSSYIEENSDVIQKFTNAVYKGQQWVASATPEEIAKMIAEFFPDTDLEILVSSIARYQEIDAYMADPFMTKESFDRLQDVMEEAGELTKRASYEDVINNTFAFEVIG